MPLLKERVPASRKMEMAADGTARGTKAALPEIFGRGSV